MTQLRKVPDNVIDYVPFLSPEFKPPFHMRDVSDLFADMLRSVRGQLEAPLRALITKPIRHYKTETVLHGIAWLLEHEPWMSVVLLAYSWERTQHLGKRLRELMRRTPVGPTRGYDKIAEWENEEDGGVLIMSADQSREGHDCHVLICDDPIDERSAMMIDKCDEVDRAINYYTARCMRNGKPGPVAIVASRQAPRDPIGRRWDRDEWRKLFSPAVLDLGKETERAFAPDVWALTELKRVRSELAESDPYEMVWWSRFQGEPRTMGVEHFNQPALYDFLPVVGGYRDAIGIDMSYVKGTKNDWYAIVVIRVVGRTIYVKSVKRFRADPRDAEAELRAARDLHGAHCPIFTYVSGPERIAITSLAERGIAVQAMQAGQNKLWRAQKTIKLWRDGEIQWPNARWTDLVLARFRQFTGQEGGEDDEVDALVSAVDGMFFMSGQGPGMIGERRFER